MQSGIFKLMLAPSYLKIVNQVIMGYVRAKLYKYKNTNIKNYYLLRCIISSGSNTGNS